MNTEKSLYLALNNLYRVIADHEVVDHRPVNTMGLLQHAHNEAKHALDQFEIELGPLPDWAAAHNITGEPVEYAQLYTRNGRRNGNGIISLVTVPPTAEDEVYYHVITDMGNESRLNIHELNEMYEIGDYILKAYGVELRKRQNWETASGDND